MTDQEIIRYRLEKIEERLAEISEVNATITRDQMKLQLDSGRLSACENKCGGLGKRVDEIREKLPMLQHTSDRVQHILKMLLSAFCMAMVGAIIYVAKMGGLD